MKFTNNEICYLNESLNTLFNDNKNYYPARVLFALHKNIKNIADVAHEIFHTREHVIQHYGELDGDGNYIFSKENLIKANEELDELLSMESTVDIRFIRFEDIKDLEFTQDQMKALMFMIEE